MELPLIAGVAGGVGTTTLAHALRAVDCGIYPGGVLVDVLVARSTMYSLGCAQRAIAAAPERPILAVVADVPGARLSRSAKARLRMTEPHVTATVVVPFVAGWSAISDPHSAAGQVLESSSPSKSLRGFADALHLLVDELRPRVAARTYLYPQPAHQLAPPGPAATFPSVSAWWPPDAE